MTGEWLSRALLLDPTAISVDAACWADAREIGLARHPILLGWRRVGGPLVAGASEGVATGDLLGAAAALARSTAQWTGERWDGAFRDFWTVADPSLRSALGERLPLPDGSWSLHAWSEAVWGTFGGPLEPPAVVVVGESVAPDVIASADASGSGGTAAFVFELLDADRLRIRCTRVAGHLDAGSLRALPGEVDLASRGENGYSPDKPYDLIEALERVAHGAGATATWSRRDWVRLEGEGGTVRVFPSRDGAWLQLAGADEGALAGLRFRHGLPRESLAGTNPPPGAHFYLARGAGLSPSIEGLIRQWLRGSG